LAATNRGWSVLWILLHPVTNHTNIANLPDTLGGIRLMRNPFYIELGIG